MPNLVSRRQTLALVGSACLGGCSSIFSRGSSFIDGQGDWSRKPPSVPDAAWPMVHRTPNAINSTRTAGPQEFPLEQQWQKNLPGAVSRPIVRDDTLLVSSPAPESTIYSLSSQDGTELWRQSRDEVTNGSPAVTARSVFVPYSHWNEEANVGVTSFGAISGDERWHYGTEASVSGDIILTKSSVLTTGRNARVVAIDGLSGQLSWLFQPGYPDRRVTSLAIGGKVYVSTSGRKTDYPDVGFVHALDPERGEVSWSVEFNSPVSRVAVRNDSVVSVTNSDLIALGGDTGSVRWQHSMESSRAIHTFGIKGETVVVSSGEKLHSFDLSEGDPLWEARAPSNAQIAISDNIVYSTSPGSGGGMAAHQLRSGTEMWARSGGRFTSPTVAYGKLFVGTEGGEIAVWK